MGNELNFELCSLNFPYVNLPLPSEISRIFTLHIYEFKG